MIKLVTFTHVVKGEGEEFSLSPCAKKFSKSLLNSDLQSTCFHCHWGWSVCDKKQTGSWNAGNSNIAKQRERNLCHSVSHSKDSLNQVWQLTAPWQLGSVKGKVAQVFLGLWLQRCSGATAHHSIKGDYMDRAICCQNKREPFYVSSCMVVWLCVCQCMHVCEGSKAKRARHRITHVAALLT